MYETPEISLLLLRMLRFCKVPIIYGNTFCDGKTLRTFGLGAETTKLIIGSIQTVQHHRTGAWLAVRELPVSNAPQRTCLKMAAEVSADSCGWISLRLDELDETGIDAEGPRSQGLM